ncbi:hypothetical protein HDU89_008051 [Geranomyces variabilis]|nr:hypothetical protein HDU89_008051 [Geranomyces variabilis]
MSAPIDAVADPCFVAPLCNFLADHKWFLDGFHLYDFFTKGVWDRFANKEWAEFVDFHCKNPGADETAFIDLLIDVVLGGEVPEDWPATFKKFVELTRTLSLDRRSSVDKDLHLELPIKYDEKDCTLAALSRKKLHEIDRLARVVHTLVERHNADVRYFETILCKRPYWDACVYKLPLHVKAIMDAGAGTGYLTHLVALQNPGAQVYAIDSDASRTVGSKDRAKRVLASSAHRYPPSILEGAVGSHGAPASPVQHITGLVDVSTVRRCAGERAILTGLHCCGDLGGRTMIEAFEHNIVQPDFL